MPSYDENRIEIFLNSVHLHLRLLRIADLGNEKDGRDPDNFPESDKHGRKPFRNIRLLAFRNLQNAFMSCILL